MTRLLPAAPPLPAVRHPSRAVARGRAAKHARHIGRSVRARARCETRVFAALAAPAALCVVLEGQLDLRGAGWTGALLWAGVAVTGIAGATRDWMGAA